MPRPRKPGAPPPKRRSRNGCWPCKTRKVKCSEEHPACLNCRRTGDVCDYSIRLVWEGWRKKKADSHLFPSSSSPLGRSVSSVSPAHEPPPFSSSGATSFNDGAASCHLSVSSLLSGITGDLSPLLPPLLPSSPSASLASSSQLSEPVDTQAESTASLRYWGVDRGFADLDLGRNDDANAITWLPPVMVRNPEESAVGVSVGDGVEIGIDIAAKSAAERTFGFRGPGQYYNDTVRIMIPVAFNPLPARLCENKMNLLYFHHFLDHTARILVPQDEPRSNPFRSILPQMALRNDNLLNLLLVYSAAHRARHLHHAEPETRIATWVQHVIPGMLKTVEQAMRHPEQRIATADLATAIMLASLEIISPASLGACDDRAAGSIPWQEHLGLAREIVSKRPGGFSRRPPPDDDDPNEGQAACAFLWGWFAYLDVMGCLSGGRRCHGSWGQWILDYEDVNIGGADPDQIDCVMGFTTRCAYVLAKIAGLARACDANRIDPDTRTVRPNWVPDGETAARAAALERDVAFSLERSPSAFRCLRESGTGSNHVDEGVEAGAGAGGGASAIQMAAVNEAFHHAGLVHLRRRVLGLPSGHADVKAAVSGILRCLALIPTGSTAAASLLFPMFTAGCELEDAAGRERMLERVRAVENTGMTQVSEARRLMQKVWERGQPWETLLGDEFIG